MWAPALALAWLMLLPATAAALPRATIESGPPERTRETRAAFAFRASEARPFGLTPTTFECRLDAGPWARCSSPRSYAGLLGGSHRFEVRAVGLLEDETPAAHEWLIETVTEVLPPPTPPVDPVNPRPPGADPGSPAPPPPPASPPRREPVRRDAGGCPYAANFPGEATSRRLESAVLCLINRERTARGRRALRASGPLHRAALAHSLDMWRRRYFGHVSRGGTTALGRAMLAGYLTRRQSGAVGEVLAWGDGRYSTPRAAVDGYMRSAPHRRVLLIEGFRDAGVGVAPGVPRAGRRGGITVTALLGRRG